MIDESSLSEKESRILDIIYNIEETKIKIGSFEFIPDNLILKESYIDKDSLISILESLKSKKQIILIDNQATPTEGYEPVIKYLVRSRIGHIIWCLYNSKQITNFQREDWQPNVADLKYIKFNKEIPVRNIPLSDLLHDSQFKQIIELDDLNLKSGGLMKEIIEKLAKKYSISNFQYKTTIEILNKLKNRTETSKAEGLVVVAGTGAGKSLAYQLPLIIWSLAKKITKHNEAKKSPNSKLWTSCTGLLLFPRVVLASDQLQSFSEDIGVVNSIIDEKIGLDSEFKKYLKIKIRKDFGGTKSKTKREIFIEEQTDIIVTNTESLKRRLYDPITHNLLKYGIDLVLYDEIHLYEGLQGSFVSGLNARLNNIISYNRKPPLFVGMSATIDKPEKHCQKLFALIDKPKLIDDSSDTKTKYSTEHHVIIKPRIGRSPLGVAIDTSSCLIHNRRDGLSVYHEEESIDKDRPKSISFCTSLDVTSRWANNLNDLEFFDFPNVTPARDFVRSYPIYYKPEQRNLQNSICDDCINGSLVNVGSCPSYANGNCWYFSRDDADRLHWIVKRPGEIEFPIDNIRSKRITAQETRGQETENIYDYFYEKEKEYGFPRRSARIDSKIDNIIASPVLEVGVDFKGISEIILFGDVHSPTAYKQKAGRGAREGNLKRGLFVMSIIQNNPISNFYFRHFDRLVHPQLNPIKLEIGNPEIIISQCFASVFDFLALNDIDLFNVKLSYEKELDEERITEEYKKALSLITERKQLKDYLERFLTKLDFKDNIIDDVINSALELINQLTTIAKIENEEKTLIVWMYLASRNPSIQQKMEATFSVEYEKFDEIDRNRKTIKDRLRGRLPKFTELLKENLSHPDNIINSIKKYEVSLK